ncbi:hypothetical protein XU18_3562 [Perkinsela sp. CCAP 1560/4]|nr:hypothetical protein XU18_3562 [Perkinsela sp. CCAP 1560/4]|eukprot:KNH05391.1 hypothetical protein XU18_3562 [Perkinsela sp. CCAP 1560/4]
MRLLCLIARADSGLSKVDGTTRKGNSYYNIGDICDLHKNPLCTSTSQWMGVTNVTGKYLRTELRCLPVAVTSVFVTFNGLVGPIDLMELAVEMMVLGVSEN